MNARPASCRVAPGDLSGVFRSSGNFSRRCHSLCGDKKGRRVEAIAFTVETKSAMERIEVRDRIDKDMGLFPGQMTLWDELRKDAEEANGG